MEIDDADLMKVQLFQNFQKTGVLDDLKANLRSQLINNLQKGKQDDDQDKNKEESSSFYSKSLMGYVIADYLRTHGYSYSYSVVVPDMKLGGEQNIMGTTEILQSLRFFDNEIKELNILDKKKQQLSALEIILNAIKKQKLKKVESRECQTVYDFDIPTGQKLENIENEFRKKMEYQNVSSNKSQSELLLRYKSNNEKMYQEQLQTEMERFRNYETAEIKAQQADMFQRQLKLHADELDKIFKEKVKKLKERESNLLNLCKMRKEELEKMAFLQRQEHISLQNQLDEKELEFQKHICNETEINKEEREHVRDMERQLKIKIREYDIARKQIQQRIEEDAEMRQHLKNKEKEMEKDNQLNSKYGMSKKEQELIQQGRDNLNFLETQRQYLSKDVESLAKDNKELEFIRDEQTKEINNLRRQIESQQSQVDQNKLEEEIATKKLDQLQKENKELKEELEECKYNLKMKREEHIQMHTNFSLEIQKHEDGIVDIEKSYLNQLQKTKDKFRYELANLKSQNHRQEEFISKLEEENNALRTEIRYIRKQNVAKDQQIEDKENLEFN